MGWRKQEVLGLQWRNVDLHAGIVRLDPGTTKSGKGRTFPINALPQLGEVFRAQREWVSAQEKRLRVIIPYVFPNQTGGRIKGFRSAWATACKRTGLIGKTPHDFRRTAVRNLERAGVPRSVAMALVGHKTEAIYRRYAIVSERDLSDGVSKLAGLQQQQQTERVVIPLAARR